MRIRLDCIVPLACNRPDDVRRYVAMLRAGKRAPAIWLIKQRRGTKYRYRIFDGAHRLRAARLVGCKTIDANRGRCRGMNVMTDVLLMVISACSLLGFAAKEGEQMGGSMTNDEEATMCIACESDCVGVILVK